MAAVAALALVACSKGPTGPMPGDDDMLVPSTTADTLGR